MAGSLGEIEAQGMEAEERQRLDQPGAWEKEQGTDTSLESWKA